MITPIQIRSRVQGYVDGNISGIDLVKYVDDTVSSDAVYEYDYDVQQIIMRYQDLFALYVEDVAKRSEHPSYYGPEKLRVLASELGQELDSVDWGGEKGMTK